MSAPTRPILVPLPQLAQSCSPSASPVSRSVGHPVHIEKNGFLLRSLTPDDVDARMLAWFSDSRMLMGLNLAEIGFDLEGLKSFVGKFDNFHNYMIGIFDKPGGLLLGFYTLDVDHKHKVGQVTTGIGEPIWLGKGVLWETFGGLLDHFYAERDVEKLSARILARNYRMIFNFRNNPLFEFEACLRQECLAPNGERLDILVFSSFKNSVQAL